MNRTLRNLSILMLVLMLCFGFASAESSFSFADLSDQTFVFSSGAGAWMTSLQVTDDGSFVGLFQDSDMGDVGESYPEGTVYFSAFEGRFQVKQALSPTAYELEIISLTTEEIKEADFIEDGIRYIASEPYGLESYAEWVLYTPGQSVSELTEDARSWLHLGNDVPALPFYVLYNVQQGYAFAGTSTAE